MCLSTVFNSKEKRRALYWSMGLSEGRRRVGGELLTMCLRNLVGGALHEAINSS